MGKSKILESITKEWELLLNIVENIPDRGQEVTGAIGNWSVAQCLIHVASWDEEVMGIVGAFINSGVKRSPLGAPPHDLNNRHLENKRDMELCSPAPFGPVVILRISS